VGLLILTEYFGKSFEEFVKILPSLKGVMKAAKITEIPDGSTLRKFRKRLDTGILDRVMLYQGHMIVGNMHIITSIDATGFPTSQASKYYISRLKYFGTENTTVRGYTKVSMAVCVYTKAIFAVDTVDSGTHDVKRLEHIVNRLDDPKPSISYVLADKGYDSEKAHEMIRERLGAEALIPARSHEDKPIHRVRGANRKRMKRELTKGNEKMMIYGKRALSETVNSVIKKVFGDILDGRNEGTRRSETTLRCIAHNYRVGMELRSSGMSV
jgi:hypothetical protein